MIVKQMQLKIRNIKYYYYYIKKTINRVFFLLEHYDSIA